MSDSEEKTTQRSIRSFVLREGKLTTGQKRALEELWPAYGLDAKKKSHFNFGEIFHNDHPITLEIGFGNGEALAALASNQPERNFVGIEVHRPGVGHLLKLAEQAQLANLKVMRADAVEVLTENIGKNSLDTVNLFFPDPWHKNRHHKRRIVQPSFLDLLAHRLKLGGKFHAATDWKDYAMHMLRLLSADERFINTAGMGNFCPRPDDRPATKFEQRGQRLGHGVWDLVFERQ